MSEQATPETNPITSDRIWKRILVTEGCWPWIGARLPTGYGRLHRDGRYRYAHRVVAALVYGPIPEGMFVCHTCDNPPCCRPDHLFIGTPTENARDRDRKGRRVDPFTYQPYQKNVSLSGQKYRGRRPSSEFPFFDWVEAQSGVLLRRNDAGVPTRVLGEEIGLAKSTVGRFVRRARVLSTAVKP